MVRPTHLPGRWPRKRSQRFPSKDDGLSELERGTGIEPVTSSLGSSRSTAELTPLSPVGVQSVPFAQILRQSVTGPFDSSSRKSHPLIPGLSPCIQRQRSCTRDQQERCRWMHGERPAIG